MSEAKHDLLVELLLPVRMPLRVSHPDLQPDVDVCCLCPLYLSKKMEFRCRALLPRRL